MVQEAPWRLLPVRHLRVECRSATAAWDALDDALPDAEPGELPARTAADGVVERSVCRARVVPERDAILLRLWVWEPCTPDEVRFAA
jgi:hypothetical protein